MPQETSRRHLRPVPTGRSGSIPETSRSTCPCGAMINLIPLATDHSVMIPVDVGRDDGGELLLVGRRAGTTVRLIGPDDVTAPRDRRRAHWGLCPSTDRWASARLAAGVPGPDPAVDPSRSGPCSACSQQHPLRYGGPVASPLCDRCRKQHGLPAIAGGMVGA